MWHVYVIQCRDNTLYTGITNNLKKRVQKHNSGKGCLYTRGRHPVKLIYSEEYSTRSDALSREACVKRLPRQKKLQLCEKEK